ncbi:MAG: UvrD-helicase domain-containing protein [Proteobacteria bacterium]|nr:UvrD-helicase domain-containing protein [Pseudomonadota bacterium]
MNEEQKEAVKHFEGPLLILAGAGSGKTRTIIYRIAYLVLNYGVSPHSILALTFTNKAAREMIQRLHNFPDGKIFRNVNASTFHSFGHRFLITNAQKINISPNFQVLDEEDQKRLLGEVLAYLSISKDEIAPKNVQRVIDEWKNTGLEMEEFLNKGFYFDFLKGKYRDILSKYEELKRERGLVDFGDLLMIPYLTLKKDEDLAKRYSERYKFILVDEYQDTNAIQYKLLKLLTKTHRNLTVVGDDDQSIYSFRGAEIRNILDFKKDFPDAKIISLGKNYRSTRIIIEAANAVIKSNLQRMDKVLIPTKEEGEKIKLTNYFDEKQEALGIVQEIQNLIYKGYKYQDIAIFYRTNQLSRRFEDALRRAKIPYKVYGGFRFYNRKEVKDILAFIRFLCNRKDVMSFSRLAVYSMDGVGKTTLDKIFKFITEERDIIEAIKMFIIQEGEKKKASINCLNFLALFEKIEKLYDNDTPANLIDNIIKLTGYEKYLLDESKDEKEAEERMKNIEELKVALMENYKEGRSYTEFINELVLEDITEEEIGNQVVLMTVHASKGLEFPVVFIVALEDDIFPHMYSKDEKNEEEERRLFYVAITRAKERLYLSYCDIRNGRGMRVSPFLKDIPAWLIEKNFVEDNNIAHFEEPKRVFVEKHENRSFKKGQRVLHNVFGYGKIIQKISDSSDPIWLVEFEKGELKRIAESFLRIL